LPIFLIKVKFNSLFLKFFFINGTHLFFCSLFIFFLYQLVNFESLIKLTLNLLINLVFNKDYYFILSLQNILQFKNILKIKFIEREFLIFENLVFHLSKNILDKKNSLNSLYFLSLINKLKRNKNIKISIRPLNKQLNIILNQTQIKNKTLNSFPSKFKMIENNTFKKFSLKKLFQLNQLNYLINERIEIQLVKKGRKRNQALGYLEDGSLIVVNNGAPFIGYRIRVKIKKILQTNTGRIFFADFINLPNNNF